MCIRDRDNLVPHLPLWEVVQDLYSTDPTQEIRPRSCRLYGSLLKSSQIIQIRNKSALKDLDHHVGIDELSELWKS